MSIVFDPTKDQEVISPTAASINNMSAFTIAVWLFLANPPTFNVVFVKDPNVSYDQDMIFESGNWAFGGTGRNGNFSSTDVHADFPSGAWHHVVATFDQELSVNRANLYLDGVLQTGSHEDGTSPVDDSGAGFYIGGDGFTEGFDGNIAEFAVWNSVLTSSEITNLASSTSGASTIRPSALQLYYHLCNITTPVADVSGNNLDGTISGSPTNGPVSPGFNCPPMQSFEDTIAPGQYGGNSLAQAFFNPSKLDLMQVVNEGGKVVWNLTWSGIATVNPNSSTLKAMLGRYEGQSFAAAFPNPYSKDVLQIIGQGDNVVFWVDHTGAAHFA